MVSFRIEGTGETFRPSLAAKVEHRSATGHSTTRFKDRFAEMTLPLGVYPRILRDYLTARQCVAFVGAGFSMPCGMPSWGDLLLYLCSEADKSAISDEDMRTLLDCKDAVSAGAYEIAASGLRRLLGKQELRRCVDEMFSLERLNSCLPDAKKRMLSRMENLVCGPWAGIITTNFDMLIEHAYERSPQFALPFRADASMSALGNILCLPLSIRTFLVKLHGDTWADQQVLSTADYVCTWLISPRVRYFLIAVMLRYHVVFIGCSLENSIVQLRQEIWAHFGKALPKAFALLPENSANRVRSRELREEAGIETLLYSNDGDWANHWIVDRFLSESRKCADFNYAVHDNGTLEKVKSLPIGERLEAIGSINRFLIALLVGQAEKRVRYEDIFDPQFDLLRLGSGRRTLGALSEGERLYRLFFLVGVQLIRETTIGDVRYFEPTAELGRHVEECPLAESYDVTGQ